MITRNNTVSYILRRYYTDIFYDYIFKLEDSDKIFETYFKSKNIILYAHR